MRGTKPPLVVDVVLDVELEPPAPPTGSDEDPLLQAKRNAVAKNHRDMRAPACGYSVAASSIDGSILSTWLAKESTAYRLPASSKAIPLRAPLARPSGR